MDRSSMNVLPATLDVAISNQNYRQPDAAQIAARTKFGIPDPEAPLCVAYGMGVDSTAMLVAMRRAGVRPDLITFADTGDELPETYAYYAVISAWCERVGFPPVVVVRYAGKHGRYNTLEENCLANKTLPSLAFGGKGCSLKFKAAVQNGYRQSWAPAKAWWALHAGPKVGRKRAMPTRKVVVCIGYDAGPKDSKRGAVLDDARYVYAYPLRALGWDRPRCEAEIAAEGLPVPMKSACAYCPSRTPAELTYIVINHPTIADRIVRMETVAEPNLTAIKGLWRNGCKGTRGSVAKPAKMSDYIASERRRLNIVKEAG
jgi:hypothetical protein